MTENDREKKSMQQSAVILWFIACMFMFCQIDTKIQTQDLVFLPRLEKRRVSYLSNQATKRVQIFQQNDINPSIMLLMLIPSNNSEFGTRRELHWLCLPAPHFDSNSPVIQKWPSSRSQEIDLQPFQFHLWNITASPWGVAPTDTEFICPFAFIATCRVLLN